jgi:hypothetical protein
MWFINQESLCGDCRCPDNRSSAPPGPLPVHGHGSVDTGLIMVCTVGNYIDVILALEVSSVYVDVRRYEGDVSASCKETASTMSAPRKHSILPTLEFEASKDGV